MTREADFVRLLQQPAQAGTYRLPQDGREALAAAAARLGFRMIGIDLAGCANKADFLAQVAEALRFPDWFGHNWDALADCLGDMSWSPGIGYVLVLEHAERFAAAAPTDFATAIDVLDGAARDRGENSAAMWTFIDLNADDHGALRTL